MTATNPRIRSLGRQVFFAWLVVSFGLVGCKSGDSGSSGSKGRDPLVYGPSRIPPQNVPLPERAGNTKGGKSDPLLDRPVSLGGEKAGYSVDPARFTGTYVPGLGTTPAALSANKNGDELKIDTPDNRVPLRPGGVQPAGAIEATSGVEPLYGELEKYGGMREHRKLTRDEEGMYVFRASVPITGNGARRHYDGRAATASEAVKQVLDQVKDDRK